MSLPESINITHLIVHMLDPDNPLGIMLSEGEIPLAANQPLAEYFRSYISNAESDEVKKAARFMQTDDDDATCSICRKILKNDIDFVQASSKLALGLQQIMNSDKRIAHGNLGVCSYTNTESPNVEFLALMKIDPSKVLRPKSVKDQRGLRLVTFEIDGQVLPSSEQKLQKCALIHPEGTHADYDLMLIDRQTGVIAQFFSQKFLGADFAFDKITQTRNLYKSVDVAVRSLQKKAVISEDQSTAIRRSLEQAFAAEIVDVPNWINSLNISAEAKEEFQQVIRRKIPNQQVEIDKTFAENELLQLRRFVGDYDLYIEVRSREADRMIQEQESDRPGFRKIVIYTQRWNQVSRK